MTRFPDDVPLLGDGVVTLRAHRADDVVRLVEQCTDPETVRWTSVPAPYGEAQARDFVEVRVPGGWADDSSWCFAVEVDGRFAGSLSLRPFGLGEAEVGFGLHPDARGRGIQRRALALLLDWGFAHRQVAVVHWRCDEGNWASRRVAWTTGFRFGPTIPARVGQPDRWTAWLGRDDPREPRAPWFAGPVLERGPVRLRPWRDDDGPRLVEAAHDPRLLAGIPHSPLPRTDAEVAGYLLQVRLAAAEGRRLAWCVADVETDEVLGNVAVFALDGDGSAEIGYWAHPAGRGRGVMTTAVALASEHALAVDGLGLRRLCLYTAASNVGSRRLAERAGFVQVGTERLTSPVLGGGWEDTAVHDRLR